MGIKRALVTGITGQDGSYLADFLLQQGYEIYGLVRRTSTPNFERLAPDTLANINLLYGDLLDQSSLMTALDLAQPDEVYNLAAMSHVGQSFGQPVATMEVTGLGTTRLLEAIRLIGGPIRFYQASTSEIVGQENQQCFYPRSPYGAAKLYAHWTTINYRESYGMYACAGILYNHESPRRGLDFVTRKITRGVARIKYGLQDHLMLGNLNAYRDWGFAGDYVRAMWAMLQQELPREFVIATGHTHSVGEFARKAFEHAGIENWMAYTEVSAELYRPNEVNILIGDASEARELLHWQPETSFDELVAMMVEADLRQVREVSYAH